MPLCPHHKYKTNEMLVSFITGSNNVNFDFRFREFQLYSHTQYLDTASIYQDRIYNLLTMWHNTTSLGRLYQILTNLLVKKYLRKSYFDLFFSSLRSFPIVM